MNSFSIKDALSKGVDITKNNFLFFAGILLLVFVVYFFIGEIEEALYADNILFGILVSIATFLIDAFVSLGFLYISFRFLDGAKPTYDDFVAPAPKYLVNYILGSLLYGIIVLGGLILLIIPGIYFAIKYSLFQYLIVDKDMKPVEAIKMSGKLTDGHKWKLLGFGLILGFINILGALALFVGLFVTIPISVIAAAYVYRTLLARLDTVNVDTAEPAVSEEVDES